MRCFYQETRSPSYPEPCWSACSRFLSRFGTQSMWQSSALPCNSSFRRTCLILNQSLCIKQNHAKPTTYKNLRTRHLCWSPSQELVVSVQCNKSETPQLEITRRWHRVLMCIAVSLNCWPFRSLQTWHSLFNDWNKNQLMTSCQLHAILRLGLDVGPRCFPQATSRHLSNLPRTLGKLGTTDFGRKNGWLSKGSSWEKSPSLQCALCSCWFNI